jgi:hypothetical protein
MGRGNMYRLYWTLSAIVSRQTASGAENLHCHFHGKVTWVEVICFPIDDHIRDEKILAAGLVAASWTFLTG